MVAVNRDPYPNSSFETFLLKHASWRSRCRSSPVGSTSTWYFVVYAAIFDTDLHTSGKQKSKNRVEISDQTTHHFSEHRSMSHSRQEAASRLYIIGLASFWLTQFGVSNKGDTKILYGKKIHELTSEGNKLANHSQQGLIYSLDCSDYHPTVSGLKSETPDKMQHIPRRTVWRTTLVRGVRFCSVRRAVVRGSRTSRSRSSHQVTAFAHLTRNHVRGLEWDAMCCDFPNVNAYVDKPLISH